MAEFCKEYIDKFDPNGIKSDFSIIEEFNKLEEDSYILYICEGYGFIGIANDNGICKLIFRKKDDDFNFIPLNELDEYINNL